MCRGFMSMLAIPVTSETNQTLRLRSLSKLENKNQKYFIHALSYLVWEKL